MYEIYLQDHNLNRAKFVLVSIQQMLNVLHILLEYLHIHCLQFRLNELHKGMYEHGRFHLKYIQDEHLWQ